MAIARCCGCIIRLQQSGDCETLPIPERNCRRRGASRKWGIVVPEIVMALV